MARIFPLAHATNIIKPIIIVIRISVSHTGTGDTVNIVGTILVSGIVY